MYHAAPVVKPYAYYHLPQCTADSIIRSSARATFDFALRMRILRAADGDTVRVPTGYQLKSSQLDYWRWFADTLKVHLYYSPDTRTALPCYESSRGGVVQFTSASCADTTGGVESTVTSAILYGADRVHVPNCDYTWHTYGLIEGYFAILGPSMGYHVTVLGDERYSGAEDRSNGEQFSERFGIEQTEAWWRMWNTYLGCDSHKPSLQSVVGCWTKDELVAKVHDVADWRKVRSCDSGTSERPWCGNCWKCGSTKFLLQAQGQPHEFIPELTPELLNKMRAEYADYLRGVDPLRSTGILTDVAYLLK